MRALIDHGTVLAGNAEAIPLEDASVDHVFAGEAFHWFDLEPALAEIRRVLAPGGGLAVLWNVPRWDAPWAAAVGEAIVRHRDRRDHPWTRGEPFALDARIHGRDDWTPVVTRGFPHEQAVTRGQFLDNVASMSFIAALDDAARAAALADVEGVLVAHGVEEMALAWRCDAHVARPR
jgi:SAM-dependent methyltransferase